MFAMIMCLPATMATSNGEPLSKRLAWTSPEAMALATKRGMVPTVVPEMQLTTALRAIWTSPVVTQKICGKDTSMKRSTRTLVDGVINDPQLGEITPWQNRMQPTLDWDVASESTLYTVVMIDPLHLRPDKYAKALQPDVCHWLVTNIRGNNMTSGTGVVPYLGSGNWNDFTNKYTLALYKQTGTMSFDMEETKSLKARTAFDLHAFLGKHSDKLERGASGLSYMDVRGDDYSKELAFKHKFPGAADFCSNSKNDTAVKVSSGTFQVSVAVLPMLVLVVAAMARE